MLTRRSMAMLTATSTSSDAKLGLPAVLSCLVIYWAVSQLHCNLQNFQSLPGKDGSDSSRIDRNKPPAAAEVRPAVASLSFCTLGAKPQGTSLPFE